MKASPSKSDPDVDAELAAPAPLHPRGLLGLVRERMYAAVCVPDVIVDVVFEEGLLFLEIYNMGRQSAYRVNVSFCKLPRFLAHA